MEAGTFRPEYFYVSDQTKYGLRIIYYETNCRSNIDEKICDFYKIEPSSSKSYAGGSTFLVEKDKQRAFARYIERRSSESNCFKKDYQKLY